MAKPPQTHCKRGHPYDSQSKVGKYIKKYCSQCQRISHVKWRDKRQTKLKQAANHNLDFFDESERYSLGVNYNWKFSIEDL